MTDRYYIDHTRDGYIAIMDDTTDLGDSVDICARLNEQDEDIDRWRNLATTAITALKIAQEDTCSLHCPSTKKTGEEWTHSKRCEAMRAVLAKAGVL